MLIVETYLAPSPIHGLGLFAAGPIGKDTKIWTLNTCVDHVLTEEQVEALPLVVQKRIKHHTYVNSHGLIILSGDGTQYMNHSDSPNIIDYGYGCFALRDIQADEELTCNYYATEPSAARKLQK
jgi:SET domain-containing protein